MRIFLKLFKEVEQAMAGSRTKTKGKKKTTGSSRSRSGSSRSRSGGSSRSRSSSRSRASSRGKQKDRVNVDFTDVESRVLLPEGDYEVKVDNISLETSKDSGEDYLEWLFRTQNVDEDRYDGQPLYFNTSLQPQALWNLRSLLEALDVDVPNDKMDLVFEDILGLDMVAVVGHEMWDGKPRARLVDFMPIDAGSGERVRVDEGDGDLEKLTEQDVEDMSEDELEDLVEKYDLDVDLSKITRMRKKQGAVIDALDDKGYLED